MLPFASTLAATAVYGLGLRHRSIGLLTFLTGTIVSIGMLRRESSVWRRVLEPFAFGAAITIAELALDRWGR